MRLALASPASVLLLVVPATPSVPAPVLLVLLLSVPLFAGWRPPAALPPPARPPPSADARLLPVVPVLPSALAVPLPARLAVVLASPSVLVVPLPVLRAAPAVLCAGLARSPAGRPPFAAALPRATPVWPASALVPPASPAVETRRPPLALAVP